LPCQFQFPVEEPIVVDRAGVGPESKGLRPATEKPLQLFEPASIDKIPTTTKRVNSISSSIKHRKKMTNSVCISNLVGWLKNNLKCHLSHLLFFSYQLEGAVLKDNYNWYHANYYEYRTIPLGLLINYINQTSKILKMKHLRRKKIKIVKVLKSSLLRF
jgi:hypothetical protein